MLFSEEILVVRKTYTNTGHWKFIDQDVKLLCRARGGGERDMIADNDLFYMELKWSS